MLCLTCGDLKQIMTDVNRVLNAKTMRNMFMTLCLMQWDAVSQQFMYVSAGHEQIVHYRNGNDGVELCMGGGIALGMLGDISTHISEQTVALETGDVLVVYSDGIPEAWKSKDENYGIDRLKEAVKKFAHLGSAVAIKEAILKDVKEFAAGYKQQDDITLIVLKKT